MRQLIVKAEPLFKSCLHDQPKKFRQRRHSQRPPSSSAIDGRACCRRFAA